MSVDQDLQMSKRDRQKARRAERLQQQAVVQKQAARKHAVYKVLAIVAGAALVGLLGYLMVQGVDVSLGGEAATVEDGATPLPPAPQPGAADPAVGATAPVVEGQTFDGEAVSIGGDGQAQAVVFMAHWCNFCQQEMPLIDDWVADGLLPEDVELVGVSTRHDTARPNWPPDDWFERENFPGTSLVDSTEVVAEAWGLSGTPMWVFIDDQGTVVARSSGMITPEQFEQDAALASGAAPADS